MPKKNFNVTNMFLSDEEITPQEIGIKDPDFQIPAGYRIVKEAKTHRMQLVIRPSTKEQLRKTAAADGISVNEWINRAIEKELYKDR